MRPESKAYSLIAGLVILSVFVLMARNSRGPYGMLDEEYEIISKLPLAKSDEERAQLVTQLDALPVHFYPFHSRWLIVHNAEHFEAWTDDGFDSTLVNLPRDIQLLAATIYGKSDIENGGLHQFFSNGTGGFSPEMIEWFERSNLNRSADVLRRAVAVFGDQFPRSQDARNEFLSEYKGRTRAEWDPLG